jgi:hypothetical protein
MEEADSDADTVENDTTLAFARCNEDSVADVAVIRDDN